jgi:hypothetical protein
VVVGRCWQSTGSPEFAGLRASVSVGLDRPLAALVCTRCVPAKIKFVGVAISRSPAPTSETAIG